MVAVPAPTPVTRPLDDTVATLVFDEPQENVDAELGGDADAVSCTVCATAIVALDGDTEIDLTFGPPFANDGSVGATGVPRWSEHESANTNAPTRLPNRISLRITDSK